MSGRGERLWSGKWTPRGDSSTSPPSSCCACAVRDYTCTEQNSGNDIILYSVFLAYTNIALLLSLFYFTEIVNRRLTAARSIGSRLWCRKSEMADFNSVACVIFPNDTQKRVSDL